MASVIYFSHAGEIKIAGGLRTVTVGNTARIAQMIAAEINAPLTPIKAIQPYPKRYQALLQRAKAEKLTLQLPAFELGEPKLLQAHTLFLGFPIWWGTLPRIVVHVLQSQDFSGTTILPFCTHEGSRFGSSLSAISRILPQATVQPGLPVRGSKVDVAQRAVTNWLQQVYWPSISKSN